MQQRPTEITNKKTARPTFDGYTAAFAVEGQQALQRQRPIIIGARNLFVNNVYATIYRGVLHFVALLQVLADVPLLAEFHGFARPVADHGHGHPLDQHLQDVGVPRSALGVVVHVLLVLLGGLWAII